MTKRHPLLRRAVPGDARPEAALRVTRSGVAAKSGKARAGAPGEPAPHLRRKRPSSLWKRAPTTIAGARRPSVNHILPRRKAPARKMTAAPRRRLRRLRSHRKRQRNLKRKSQHHRSQRSSCRAARRMKRQTRPRVRKKTTMRRAATPPPTMEKGSLPRTAALFGQTTKVTTGRRLRRQQMRRQPPLTARSHRNKLLAMQRQLMQASLQ